MAISTLMLENEKALRARGRGPARACSRSGSAMEACVKRGCEREGILPGGLKVKRRAAALLPQAQERSGAAPAIRS